MVCSVEFHLAALMENEQLQLALRRLLNEEDVHGIKEIFDYVR